MTYDAVDLYAGAGGWDVAAGALGLQTLGIENDDACLETRRAVGFDTEHEDIRNLDPIPAPGLIASPPCQTFSSSGKGSGRRNLDEVLSIAYRLILGDDWWKLTKNLEDERTALVLEPLHWIFEMRKTGTPYRWIAMEQVPPVLPVWKYYVELLAWMGYSATAGLLHAEQYGVPQTRKRAILIASLDRQVSMPTPTHSAYYPRDPQRVDSGVHKWVSMAEALGWGMTERPYPVLAMSRTTGGPDKEKVGGSGARAQIYRERDEGRWKMRASLSDSGYAKSRNRPLDEPAQTVIEKHRSAEWTHDRPATTITSTRRSSEGGLIGHSLDELWPDRRPATTVNGDPRISKPGHHDENTSGSQQEGAVRVSITEAAVLQSFPDNFPWQGTKTARFRQVGNAIPPLLALHVLAAVTGRPIFEEESNAQTREA